MRLAPLRRGARRPSRAVRGGVRCVVSPLATTFRSRDWKILDRFFDRSDKLTGSCRLAGESVFSARLLRKVGNPGCTPIRAAAAAPARLIVATLSITTKSVRNSLARTAPKQLVRVPVRVFLFYLARFACAPLGNPFPAFAGGFSGVSRCLPRRGGGSPGC